MGKLFWIGSGVGLVAAVGLWGAVTRSVSDDVADLRGKVDARRNQLIVWATTGSGKKQKFGDIVNQSFINVENVYKQKLTGISGELLKQMRARNMDIGPEVWDKPPPMHEVSLFRTWLTTKYNKRNNALRAKDVVVPDDAAGLGEVPDWDNVVKEDLPRILREYRISCVVFSGLAEAFVKVHYRAKVKNKDGVMEVFESDEDQTRRIIAIESLRFEDSDGTDRGRPRRPRAGAVEKKAPLFKEYTFTVKFDAHHGVAFDFIRRLEESKAGIFIIRTVEVGRIDRLDLRRGTSDDEADPYKNKIEVEAPVVAEVTASLLEFIEREGG